jgi:hypothetical protein
MGPIRPDPSGGPYVACPRSPLVGSLPLLDAVAAAGTAEPPIPLAIAAVWALTRNPAQDSI